MQALQTIYRHSQGEEKNSITTNGSVVMTIGLKNPCFHTVSYLLVDRLNSPMQPQMIKESINHISY